MQKTSQTSSGSLALVLALVILEEKPVHESIPDFVASLKRSWAASKHHSDHLSNSAVNQEVAASSLSSLLKRNPSLNTSFKALLSISTSNHPQIDPANISSLTKKSRGKSELASKSTSTIFMFAQSEFKSISTATNEDHRRKLEELMKLCRWSFEVWMNELDRCRVYEEIMGEGGRSVNSISFNDTSAVTLLLDICISSVNSPEGVDNIRHVESFLRAIPLCAPRSIINDLASSTLRSTATMISKISASLRWSLDGSHVHVKAEMELAQSSLHRIHETLILAFELWIPITNTKTGKQEAVQILKDLEGLLRCSLDGYRVEDRIGVAMEGKILRLLELIWTRLEGLGGH